MSQPANRAEHEEDERGIFMKMIERDFYDILLEQAENISEDDLYSLQDMLVRTNDTADKEGAEREAENEQAAKKKTT